MRFIAIATSVICLSASAQSVDLGVEGLLACLEFLPLRPACTVSHSLLDSLVKTGG
ncbi:hypothetical protein LepocDRAFT_00005320 [Leptothrix ochracea L12]|uniref:Uncharacterized protein n=1 Tax=Leptothrix ochracea L12 TaxID=735332 RepID=I4Z6E8_9BURK|nr:hypothetical protein [Leptothrix ochracea]EIM31790.1 hypothetical protein LepocDRAFT_00005320 [Leptothrix ochracea L12]